MYLLKRYATGLAALSLFAAAPFTLSTTALAQDAAATPATATAIPENLYGVIKLPPLPVLTEHVMAVARKIEPGPQTEMLPMLFLGSFGYPSFPGVSRTEGVSVFVLKGETEDDIEFVAYAKLAEDSPSRAALASEAWQLQIQDRDGWTLIARTEEAFGLIKDNAALAALAADTTDFGAEARLYVSDASKALLTNFFDEIVAESEESEAAEIKAWHAFAQKLLNNIEWVGYGISLNAETLSVGAVASPKPGTAEAKWIQTPVAGGRVSAGESLPANTLIGYIGQIDIPATEAYLNWLTSVARDIPNADVREIAVDGISLYTELLKSSDGKFASIATEVDFEEGKAHTQSVSTGTFELAQVDAAYKLFTDKLFPKFIELIGDKAGEDIGDLVKFVVKTDVEKIGGQSVSALIVEAKDTEAGEMQETPAAYYTVSKGSVLSADSIETLTALVTAYNSGKPVANNLADALPLAANTWARGTIDFKGFVKAFVAEIGEEDSANSAKVLAVIEKADIKPVDLEFKASGPRALYRINASVDSIVAAVKAYNEIEALRFSDQAVEVIEVEAVEVVPATVN